MHLDLLAFAAHPDDVELACAGTMRLAKKAGKRTGIVDLTRGELSTRGTLETRAKETEAASKIMQLDYRTNLQMSDGNIELSQDNLRQVIREIRRTTPTAVLAPSPKERHPDHEAAAELVHRAIFYAGLQKYETRDEAGNLQKHHRPLLALNFMQTYSFEPSIVIDVSEVFEDRMKTMEAFGSQFFGSVVRDKSEKETFLSQAHFFDWLRARAGHYGMLIGVQYGEPFWSHEPLGTKDLFSLVTKRVA
jgi:N-acetylglucosamine malate deacetylase 1